jgi:NADPH2:quinone reductase
MQAVTVTEFGSFENAALQEWPDPVPGEGEVLVRIEAAAANYVDLLTIGGTYQFKPKLPFIPGKGPAGVIESVGAKVTRWKPGDRVLAMVEYGGYATRVVAPEGQCYRLPDGLSTVEAASMGLAFDTSWFALRDRARIAPGETALVLGATGAVGLAAVQLAKAMGAKVLAAVSSAAKAQAVIDAGADGVVDLSQGDMRDSLRDQVFAQTGGAGADVIIDPLGGDVFDAAIRALAWRGRLVVIGFAAGRIPTLKMNYLLLKNIEVSGLQVSDYRKRKPEQVAQCYAELFAFYEAGKLKPLPSTTLPLARFADALRAIRDRTASGRMVLVP